MKTKDYYFWSGSNTGPACYPGCFYYTDSCFRNDCKNQPEKSEELLQDTSQNPNRYSDCSENQILTMYNR